MKPTIEIGDLVRVDFNNAHFTLCKEARVRAKPQATGDSWQFLDAQTGEIRYVSEGCTITKLEDAEPFAPAPSGDRRSWPDKWVNPLMDGSRSYGEVTKILDELERAGALKEAP